MSYPTNFERNLIGLRFCNRKDDSIKITIQLDNVTGIYSIIVNERSASLSISPEKTSAFIFTHLLILDHPRCYVEDNYVVFVVYDKDGKESYLRVLIGHACQEFMFNINDAEYKSLVDLIVEINSSYKYKIIKNRSLDKLTKKNMRSFGDKYYLFHSDNMEHLIRKYQKKQFTLEYPKLTFNPEIFDKSICRSFLNAGQILFVIYQPIIFFAIASQKLLDYFNISIDTYTGEEIYKDYDESKDSFIIDEITKINETYFYQKYFTTQSFNYIPTGEVFQTIVEVDFNNYHFYKYYTDGLYNGKRFFNNFEKMLDHLYDRNKIISAIA